MIFSLSQYLKTAQAFLRGIKRLAEDKKGDVGRIASVASVFVSRIDTAVDKRLDDMISNEQDESVKNKLKSLRGKAAVANSGMIFQKYREIFFGPDFKHLNDVGLRVQRVLWGSTGTKDPSYSDIKYVTELIGNPTVNTLPQKTLNAFMDHGTAKETLTADAGEAAEVVSTLKGLGIDLNEVCAQLLDEGVVAFEKSFDSLLSTIESKKKVVIELLSY